MFAEIVRLPVGLLIWSAAGLSAGWLVALLMNRRGSTVLLLMGLGLIGALVGGLAVGLSLRGDDAFMSSIFAAVVGGFVLPGIAWVVQRRRAV